MLFAAEWKSGTPPWVLCADTHAFYFSCYHTKSDKVAFLLNVCALSLFSLKFSHRLVPERDLGLGSTGATS